MKPNEESFQRSMSQNGYKRDYSSMEPFQSCSQIKVITLRRKGTNMPLGFSIRGGWEHGTGIFVSEVQPGSIAQRQGLRVGDQIVRINGFSIHRAIHMEVLSLLKTCPGVVLKVKRIGILPIKERRKDPVTWKVVDSHSVHSQQSLRESARIDDYLRDKCVVVKIEFSVLGATSLGCSIAKGPPEMPGIFMCTVKAGGVADEAGLEIGDQIVDMNGQSFEDMKLADAVALMKSSKDIKLTVKKKAGISLFPEQPLLRDNNSKNGSIVADSLQRRQRAAFKEHTFSGSSSSKSEEEESSFPSSDSEKDYSISEESGIHSLKQNGRHLVNGIRHKKSASLTTTVSGGSSSDDAYQRMDDRWILEEKRKLEDQQKKLMIEKQQLEEERRRLKALEKSASCSSSSSEDTTAFSSPGISSGFLQEIQKKAAKMSIKEDGASIDERILERRNEERNGTLKKEGIKGKDDEDMMKRRQHEMLMQEFRQAHKRMFGQNGANGTIQNEQTIENINYSTHSTPIPTRKPSPPVPSRSYQKTQITVNGQTPGVHSQTLPRPDRTAIKSIVRQQTSLDDMESGNGAKAAKHQINFRVTFDTKRPGEHQTVRNKNTLVAVNPWNTRL